MRCWDVQVEEIRQSYRDGLRKLMSCDGGTGEMERSVNVRWLPEKGEWMEGRGDAVMETRFEKHGCEIAWMERLNEDYGEVGRQMMMKTRLNREMESILSDVLNIL